MNFHQSENLAKIKRVKIWGKIKIFPRYEFCTQFLSLGKSRENEVGKSLEGKDKD